MQNIKRTKFNVCLLGEGHVGKTCIASVYTGHHFDENTLMTVGLDNYTSNEKFDGEEYKFKIFDTAGQERYRSISTNTIQISDGFLVVFAVNDRESFDHISYWINIIEEKTDFKKKVIILVGNKIDLQEREVTNEEAVNFAKEKDIKYFETSAKTGFGIKESFKQLYEDVYKKYKENEKINKAENNEMTVQPVIQLNEKKHVNDESQKKKNCC